MKNTVILLLVVGLAVVTAQPGWRDDMALRDTLATMGSLMGHRWLEKHGLEDYLLRQSWKPDSQGLKCIGRWSYGPSLKVSLRVTPDDTVICLTRGSGASLIRFRSQDSVTLDLLGDVNFAGIPRRAIISDTLVIAGIHQGGTGLEIHGISSPASPNLLSRIDLTVVNDIAVDDTLVYVACEDDTLRVFNIADPRSPELIGAYRDSCDLFMAQAGDYCYLVHVSGVNIVDVSDPTAPHRAGHIGGGEPLAVCVRDTLCYVTIYEYGLRVYNISDPAMPVPVGSLTGPDALDITMAATCDTVIYTPVLDIISVADPAHPRLLGHVDIPADRGYGVRTAPALDCAFVADYFDGIVAVDITNPATPTLDTMALAAGLAVDISLDGSQAYVASQYSGLTILDVSNPTLPTTLGAYDTVGQDPVFCAAAVGRDSFAFLAWLRPRVLTIDVSDPTRPSRAGGCEGMFAYPEDTVLRDSFLFCAEANRFQVVNVARPREPEVVGSCNTQDGVYFGLVVQDSFAYLMSGRLQIINIARPNTPVVVSSTSVGGATGIAVRDTFVYVPYGYDTLRVFSASDPTAPRLLGYAPLQTHAWDVALAESAAAVATFNGLELFSLENPSQPRWRGAVTTPYGPRRVVYSSPHFYAAMWDAGVAIYETTATGILESACPVPREPSALTARPNPTRGACVLIAGNRDIGQVTVRDAAGRTVLVQRAEPTAERRELTVNLSGLRTGIYFLEVDVGKGTASAKLVKQ